MEYLILSPDYCRTCAGVRALHKLCHYLNEAGHRAHITSSGVNPVWNTPTATEEVQQHISTEGIVIYPEITLGNPLGAKRVVRYLLNRPGLIAGDKAFDPSELLFCYCGLLRQFVPSDDRILSVPVVDTKIFTDTFCKRVGGCYWIGGRGEALPDTENLTEITYSWPDSWEALASLFQQSKVFYSGTDYTALTIEARLCGCPTVIAPSGWYTWDDFRHGSPGGIAGLAFLGGNLQRARKTVGDFPHAYYEYEATFGAQLERFINITQEVH